MSRPPRVKWPGAQREDKTPFEKFKELAEHLIRVPKAELEKQASLYRAQRQKKRGKSR